MLQYLADTYVWTGEATVLGTFSDSRGLAVVLDQTIFHPQGGGQPCDVGTLQPMSPDSLPQDPKIDVVFAGMSPQGAVLHYVRPPPTEGASIAEAGAAEWAQRVRSLVSHRVKLSVDGKRRMESASAHTGGHLLAAIVKRHTEGKVVATKGYHFPDGPYVQFEGPLPAMDPTRWLADINAGIAAEIAASRAVTTRFATEDELGSLGIMHSPTHGGAAQPCRLVTIESLESSPCGGTHLRNLGEYASVSAYKISNKKGITKISYRAELR